MDDRTLASWLYDTFATGTRRPCAHFEDLSREQKQAWQIYADATELAVLQFAAKKIITKVAEEDLNEHRGCDAV